MLLLVVHKLIEHSLRILNDVWCKNTSARAFSWRRILRDQVLDIVLRPHYTEVCYTKCPGNVRLFDYTTTAKLARNHLKRLNIVFVMHEHGHHAVEICDLPIFLSYSQTGVEVNNIIRKNRQHHLRHVNHQSELFTHIFLC